MLKGVTKFITKETVLRREYCYSEAGVLTDPTLIKITIVDSAGADAIRDASMSFVSAGIYEYKYTLLTAAPAGGWRGEVIVTDGEDANAVVTIDPFTFDVVAAL